MARPKKTVAEAEKLSPANLVAQASGTVEKLSTPVAPVQIMEGAHSAQKQIALRLPSDLRLPLGVLLSLVFSGAGELLLRNGAKPQQDVSQAGMAAVAAWKVSVPFSSHVRQFDRSRCPLSFTRSPCGYCQLRETDSHPGLQQT
jgi:hypothetical protein